MIYDKNTTSDDINDIMVESLNRDSNLTKFSGKFVGVVVDVNDPEKIGRVRVRVHGVFGDNVADSDLPWAIPEFSFIGSNTGSFLVPPINTVVYVYFTDDEIYLPVYMNKVLNLDQLPDSRMEDYPNNLVFFETDNGDIAEINTVKRTAKFTHANGSKVEFNDNEVIIEHSSGSIITMDEKGDITISSVGSIKKEHGLFLEDDGGFVIPSGVGPYMALPTCPFSGMVLTGQKCSPGPK